jgi:hypothetical protein
MVIAQCLPPCRVVALAASVFILGTTVFARNVLAEEKKETSKEVIAKLKSFTDEQLRRSLEKLLDGSGFREDPLYEPCLSEIVCRGGKTWEAFLKAKLEILTRKKFRRCEGSDETDPGSLYNLELLTALRRVQKKSDPLVVLLDAKGPLEATPLSLPRLKVTIKNEDGEKIAAGFTDGGDYRTGRQARWRVVVRDAKGRELPIRELSGILILGGQFTEILLEHGKAWETVLDLGSFVKIPQPGTYSLEVLYHNTKTIADESDISGLVVSRSKPIALVVRSLVIELTAQERKQAAEWILALDANQRLKIVAGSYGEWAHKFVPPNTPEGKLLGMGVKAAPALIESLRDKSLSDKKRAWILALLFSATGENDPRESGALGGYDYQEGGWQIWGGLSGEQPSGGLGCGSEGSVSAGKIDRGEQDKLIAAWVDWLKTVKVRQGGSDDGQKPGATGEKRSK